MKELQNRFSYLTENEIEILESIGGREKYTKGDIILDVNIFTSDIYLVENGIVCGYSATKNFDERVSFLTENYHPFISPESFFNQTKKSSFTFEAVTDVSIFRFNFPLLETYASKNSGIFHFYSDLIKDILGILFSRINDFIHVNAEVRYLRLTENRPFLVNNVIDKYLAPFLGITPTSLSRLRRKINKP